jgi:hypothetical protein
VKRLKKEFEIWKESRLSKSETCQETEIGDK